MTGCRVLELAHVMAGPVAGMMLADMGADVVKVEKRNGDDTRRMIPPVIEGESAAYMMMNRNKRGVVLNLKSDGGRKALLRLVRDADVLIENYRMGTMERMGLGYDTLKSENPALVYCAVSGFGRTGPYAHRGGFDLITQGMSGLMSITGEAPGRPPVKSGAPVTDITAGVLAAMGILAAYVHRLKTGEGQMVDTSLFEAGIIHTYWQSAIAMATGQAPGAMGSAHPLSAPYQAFETADGWVSIGAANQVNWEKLVEILDRGDLKEDSRFRSNDLRMKNREALEQELTRTFRTRTSEDWLDCMERDGLPAGPILDVSEMHRDPQAIARKMILSLTHPVAGQVGAIGFPVKFSGMSEGTCSPAPLLGQHTRGVLAEVGYSEEELDLMMARGDAAESPLSGTGQE